MNKRARARSIQKILQHYFPRPAIPLDHKDVYTLLISVLLSAQCTDKRVNTVTPKLFALADTPQAMMEQKMEEVEKIIRPCGLSKTKAKAIIGLSRLLIEKYKGKIPASLEELQSLPGVGCKTASVVMAQGFGLPAFPVDTHIFRSAHRWRLSCAKTIQGVERDLKALFPKKYWSELHLQIIYFARAFCPARGHRMDLCPICSTLE